MDDERTLPIPEAEHELNWKLRVDSATRAGVERGARPTIPVVGVGASPEDVESVGEFLGAMPLESGVAIVVIQHLLPDRESQLPAILARHTTMPVRQAGDGMALEPNQVYVGPRDRVVTMRGGRLFLGAQLDTPGVMNRPVDDFLRSLAEEQGERAMCVITRGLGLNGVAGAEAINAVGGLSITQDAQSEGSPTLPEQIILDRCAEHVRRPAELPGLLLEYLARTSPEFPTRRPRELFTSDETESIRHIVAIIQARGGDDFRGYKSSVLWRRIQRRMELSGTAGLDAYAKLLRQSAPEVATLAADIRTHFTGFFRDTHAWDTLRREVIRPLVDRRVQGASLRGWVPACSSGEEAYSLAMLMIEETERVGKILDIKVFATDVAESDLAHARRGLYSARIESEVSRARLDRFFDREAQHYRARGSLRERIVFARHNLLEAPPFSNQDVVVCRNLFVYLEPEIQRRTVGLFHFALRGGGALFLGKNESTGGAKQLFEPIDADAGIFRQIGERPFPVADFPAHQTDLTNFLAPRPAFRSPNARTLASIAQLSERTLLKGHTFPAVVVDRSGQIVSHHGYTRPFVQQNLIESTRDLMALLLDGVREAAHAALSRALDQNTRASVHDGWVELAPGSLARVAVTASPVNTGAQVGRADYFVVSFDQREEIVPRSDASRYADQAPGTELRRIRATFHRTIEALRSNNDGLVVANEEAMSLNAELQIANEELESRREEMRTLNEELQIVNATLQVKIEEQQGARNDLASLLASADIAVLFLDRNLRIRRYTEAFRSLVEMIPSDIGRPMSDLAWRFVDPKLEDDARSVLERLVPIEREVAGTDGRYYLRRILPYRAMHRIDGVVLTFIDITERKRMEEALRTSEERVRLALTGARTGVWTWDLSSGTQTRDENLNRLLGLEPVESTQPFAEFLEHIHPDHREAVALAFASSVKDRLPLNLEFRVARRDGSASWLRIQGDVLRGSQAGLKMAGACVDITDVKNAQDALRRARDELEARVAERTAELAQANETLTELLRRLVTAQEDERRRVSRELHDDLGQDLTALTLGLKSLERLLPQNAQVQERLREVKGTVGTIGRKAHDLAVELRPTALDDIGLDPALTAYVGRWADRTGIRARLQTVGLDDPRLAPEVETSIYRLVQEALNNIVKHARASRVSVIIERSAGEVSALVEDDGRGFDPARVDSFSDAGHAKLGLISMRERISLLGGSLLIESGDRQGTMVRARIPLAESRGGGGHGT